MRKTTHTITQSTGGHPWPVSAMIENVPVAYAVDDRNLTEAVSFGFLGLYIGILVGALIIASAIKRAAAGKEAMNTKPLPDLLTHAMILAQSAHAGQRYGDLPYVAHLHQVLDLAMLHQVEDVEMLCACVLHDVLEDTPVTYARLLADYGERVAELVYAVTDERGRDRDERHRKTLPKIRAAGDDAVLVKLLDRLANVTASCGLAEGETPGIRQTSHLLTYVREYPEFRGALMRAQTADWTDLDMAMERAANLVGLTFLPGFAGSVTRSRPS